LIVHVSRKIKIAGHQPEKVFERKFTDRDHGEGFVLSAFRLTSWTGKSKHIISYSIYAAGYGCMESKLFSMCQKVIHVYKLIVNRPQMYNNNLFI